MVRTCPGIDCCREGNTCLEHCRFPTRTGIRHWFVDLVRPAADVPADELPRAEELILCPRSGGCAGYSSSTSRRPVGSRPGNSISVALVGSRASHCHLRAALVSRSVDSVVQIKSLVGD